MAAMAEASGRGTARNRTGSEAPLGLIQRLRQPKHPDLNRMHCLRDYALEIVQMNSLRKVEQNSKEVSVEGEGNFESRIQAGQTNAGVRASVFHQAR